MATFGKLPKRLVMVNRTCLVLEWLIILGALVQIFACTMHRSSQATNVCCIGAGYVGGPTGAVIANQCPDITVTVADLNQERIDAWNSEDMGKLPIHERGLAPLVQQQRGKNLLFTTDIAGAIATADIILICVNTPTKARGKGEGMASDMSYFEQAVRTIAKHSKGHKIIVEKSTVPCKTAKMIENIFANVNPNCTFDILSNPEFLAEGTAINDLLHPDRVLIGGPQTASGFAAIEKLAEIYARWIDRERIITVNLFSAELAKLASNAFLAQRISSINAMSAVCERVGADVQQISNVIGMDSRIGKQFLNSSVGFGGSCFQKDILNLVYLCNNLGLPEVAEYWLQIVKLNDYQKSRFATNIIHKLNGTISLKKVAIFGFAFKKNTADTRESPAIKVIEELAKEGGKISIYDPFVKKSQIINDLKGPLGQSIKNVTIAESVIDAVRDASAIAVITDWEGLTELDFGKIFTVMSKPAFIFDGKLALVSLAAELNSIGFVAEFLGKSFEK